MVGKRHLGNIESRIRDGWGGRLLASYHTSVIDKIISDIVFSVDKRPPFAVFATGSYGREELCPYSDVDVLIFARRRDNGEAAAGVFYRLWDRGLDVGHAFRTPEECIEEAFKDIRTRTSLLEARFVCGDPELNNLYHEEVLQKIRAVKKKEFAAAKLREIRERHGRQGNSPFLLQPDVKESRGGLRDIQGAIWLTSVLFKFGGFSLLRMFLSEDDYNKCVKAYDFILRLRFVIHVLSRRKNDKLLFELQDDAATMLGVKSSKKFTAVERMMRYYFIKAGAVSSYSDRIFRICGKAITHGTDAFKVRKINDTFWISKDKIIVKSDDILKKDPVKIMETFHIYSKTGFDFSEHLMETIKHNIVFINAASRKNTAMVRYFFSVLRSDRVYRSLRVMHETGVLGRFIPEFGSLRHLLVNNYYHEYPVDEHSLRGIKMLESVRTTNDEKHKRLSVIMGGIRRRELLYLALLLHDIGKSKGRHHEKEGYKGIKNVAERFMMESESREYVEYLVKNHTMMSDTAFKHDIESPDVIASFAEKVSTEERLDALYLVTYADISSVSSGFWTQWRAALLHGLYLRTKDYIRGVRVDREGYVEKLLKKCADAADIKDFIAVMTEDYLISTPPEKIRMESAVYGRALREGFAMRIRDRDDGTTEIVIAVPDREGIFSDIAGVFAVRKLNIIEAKIFTSENGLAVDRIKVSNWNDLWWDGMDELIEKELKDVLLNGKNIIIEDRFSRKRGIESFIEVDNEKGKAHTFVEVMAPDRMGLLYEITRVFIKNGINITNGKIYTEQDIANDVFYVNAGGKKLDSSRIYGLVCDLWHGIRD